MNNFNVDEFYPTPESLLREILSDVDWYRVKTFLEPSAGTGNIANYVRQRMTATMRRSYGSEQPEPDIDCIEIDKDLQSVLKGRGFRVVHDDFLTFRTWKQYDLIVMNPPFSQGAKHLLKALELQENGGHVVCILNAETLRNPYTNERKLLLHKLDDLDAKITYRTGAFSYADRRTNVEIAVIDAVVPATQKESHIFEKLKKKEYAEAGYEENTEVAPSDYLEAAVLSFNLEVQAGLELIREYEAMSARFPHFENGKRNVILGLSMGRESSVTVNGYVKAVRSKYWDALFDNPRFTGNMTSNLLNSYRKDVEKLAEYDFSVFNIRSLQLDMQKRLVDGVHECIIKLFDKLSYQHAYDDDLRNNIHYFDGWKTNKSWFINQKVIIPWVRAFSEYSRTFEPTRYNLESIGDIEKALIYLDSGRTPGEDLWTVLDKARRSGQTRKIRCRYFDIDFYKKGTAHIYFRDKMLLKKLNLYGSQRKGWLPQGYGKKAYSDMTREERAVVDSAEGKAGYDDTCRNYGFYHFDPLASLAAIEQNEDKTA